MHKLVLQTQILRQFVTLLKYDQPFIYTITILINAF